MIGIFSDTMAFYTQLKANKAKTEAQKKLERELSKERKLLWVSSSRFIKQATAYTKFELSLPQFADKVLQLGQIKMSPEQLHEQVEKLQIDMWNEEN